MDIGWARKEVVTLMTKDAHGTSEAHEPSSEEEILIARTDANCTNPQIGKLLGAYLGDSLGAPQKEEFEKHMDDCLSCDLCVNNWFQLRQALRRPFRR
jgi:Putative zinc-finger